MKLKAEPQSVLVCFIGLAQTSYLGTGNLGCGIVSIRLVCEHLNGTFSCLMIDVQRPSLLWALLTLGR